jgi:hypothetical protein
MSRFILALLGFSGFILYTFDEHYSSDFLLPLTPLSLAPLALGYRSLSLAVKGPTTTKQSQAAGRLAKDHSKILGGTMKMRLTVALIGLAISFALPSCAQQKNTIDPQLAQQIRVLPEV